MRKAIGRVTIDAVLGRAERAAVKRLLAAIEPDIKVFEVLAEARLEVKLQIEVKDK